MTTPALPLSPQHLVTMVLLSAAGGPAFPSAHRSESRSRLSRCAWLTLLSITSSLSICVATHDRTSLFLWLDSIPLCVQTVVPSSTVLLSNERNAEVTFSQQSHAMCSCGGLFLLQRSTLQYIREHMCAYT